MDIVCEEFGQFNQFSYLKLKQEHSLKKGFMEVSEVPDIVISCHEVMFYLAEFFTKALLVVCYTDNFINDYI